MANVSWRQPLHRFQVYTAHSQSTLECARSLISVPSHAPSATIQKGQPEESEPLMPQSEPRVVVVDDKEAEVVGMWTPGTNLKVRSPGGLSLRSPASLSILLAGAAQRASLLAGSPKPDQVVSIRIASKQREDKRMISAREKSRGVSRLYLQYRIERCCVAFALRSHLFAAGAGTSIE